LFLDVEVPGGQQVYVNTDGSLGYTQAHSAFIPPGALTVAFVNEQAGFHGEFGFSGGALVACITDVGYQVFAEIPGFIYNATCLGFDAWTFNYTGVAAWEYT